jgi:hypothetical protein
MITLFTLNGVSKGRRSATNQTSNGLQITGGNLRDGIGNMNPDTKP